LYRNWKLHAPQKSWKLFDLKGDPTELHDLAADHPERVRELTAMWEAWAKRSLVK